MALQIPQLNSCCCGCTLKTGTKIIGWLELVGGIFMVVTGLLAFAALTAFQDSASASKPGNEELVKMIPIMKILLGILIVVALSSCVVSFILLLGVYQNKSQLVMIWIVATLITTVISLAINLGQTIAFHDINHLTNIISFLVNIYFVLVVYSYYREIRNVSNNYA